MLKIQSTTRHVVTISQHIKKNYISNNHTCKQKSKQKKMLNISLFFNNNFCSNLHAKVPEKVNYLLLIQLQKKIYIYLYDLKTLIILVHVVTLNVNE